jgi:hypothetical protein
MAGATLDTREVLRSDEILDPTSQRSGKDGETMRRYTMGVLACLVVGVAAGAESPNAELMAPIQKFIDSFNQGDAAAAASTHTTSAELAIIDEIPPYLWIGPQAFQTWSAALDADSKRRGITDQAVTISAATRVEAGEDQAYVVVPAVYTFKEQGVAMREAAQMTFALRKGAGGWLIHGWTWTGPKPEHLH